MKHAMMNAVLQHLAVAIVAAGLSFESASSQPAGAAADNAGKLRDIHGEWERAGAGFACKVGPTARIAAQAIKPELLTRACLHLGPFVVGDDAQVLKTAFGAPPRTLSQPNGAIAWVYFLEKPEQYPYLVAVISKNRIFALQVTGPSAAKGYTYNHIDLGATTDTLVQYFGQPSHFEPSEEKDTELWTYGPQPFSFEVRGGHVSSIRIHEP
jgi:hypothetical protein